MIGAVDIGGTKVAVGVVDNNGRVLSSQEAPTGSDSEYARARHDREHVEGCVSKSWRRPFWRGDRFHRAG